MSQIIKALQSICLSFIALFLALFCIILFAVSALGTNAKALADTDYTDADPDALQLEVERTAQAYDEAVAQAAQAKEAIIEHNVRVAELEEAIPLQKARSNEAAVSLYKFQQQTPDIIDFLLDSTTFYDLVINLDYVNYVTQSHWKEMDRLIELKNELDEELVTLEAAQNDANERVNESLAALSAAQEARLEAQRKAQEAQRQKAEAAAAATTAAAGGASTQASSDASVSEQGEVVVTTSVTNEAGAAAVAAVDDGANWSSDEAAFVQSWAGRIDAYLSGTPLAGQGATFAQAAWNYGVDPRWSPAISFTESSCGAACFLPHNAWGWGSISWDSWEEAIDAHVRGLARGYGYTISMEAAQKYCPPNAQHWYDTTLDQMNQI